jgi:hypothetical protein
MHGYRWLFIVGFILVFTGFALPWLMMLKLVEPTFLLSFLSFGASISGVLLGTIGAFYYVAEHRKREP